MVWHVDNEQGPAPPGRESGHDSQQPTGGGPDMLIVPYDGAKKAGRAVFGIILLALFATLVFNDEFALHLIGVAGFMTTLLFLAEWLATSAITLEPDRIVKRRLFFGDTVIPSRRAVMTMDLHTIRFYHGNTVNRRERITIRLSMIAESSRDAIVEYADTRYEIRLAEVKGGEGEGTTQEGSGTGKGRKIGTLLLEPYTRAISIYRSALGFMGTFFAIAVITVGTSDDFAGLAPELPAFTVRLVCILLAVGAYPLLRMINPANAAGGDGSSPVSVAKLPWSQRFKGLENHTTASAVVVTGVFTLGFVLFMQFGNILDFYLFQAVGMLYYLDFYPHLSVWERLSEGRREQAAETGTALLVDPPPTRRRSLQVSLVVMGALAVSSYGQSHNYLYKNKKDCLDDWGSEQSCTEPPTGSGYYQSGYYFGPRYGTYYRSSNHSVGAVPVSRGGFGALGSFHASFGG